MAITVIRNMIDGIPCILCRDGEYRSHPKFGNNPECVKVYRNERTARTQADMDDADTVTFNPLVHTILPYGRVELISNLQNEGC